MHVHFDMSVKNDPEHFTERSSSNSRSKLMKFKQVEFLENGWQQFKNRWWYLGYLVAERNVHLSMGASKQSLTVWSLLLHTVHRGFWRHVCGQILYTTQQKYSTSIHKCDWARPGCEWARNDLSHYWLQMRLVSCDMRCEHTPPLQLMYATVAVLSIWTNTCLPWSNSQNRYRANSTARNSRQLVCQCSRGPVHEPEAAHPLHTAHQTCSDLIPRHPDIKIATRMPTYLSGLSKTLVKTQGDRDSPKMRTLYWYAQPSKAKRRSGLCRGKIETWMYTYFRSITANQSRGRMHMRMHFCVSILNCSSVQVAPEGQHMHQRSAGAWPGKHSVLK